MQLIVHDHAEADLERLFESKEEAVGYIDSVIALIDDTPALFDKLFSEKNCRDYDQPIGLLGMECKRVAVLWRGEISAGRVRPCGGQKNIRKKVRIPCHYQDKHIVRL